MKTSDWTEPARIEEKLRTFWLHGNLAHQPVGFRLWLSGVHRWASKAVRGRGQAPGAGWAGVMFTCVFTYEMFKEASFYPLGSSFQSLL